MVYGPPKSPMGSHIQVSVSFGNVWGDGNDTGHFSLSPISIENVRSHCNPVNSLKRPAEFPYADDSQIDQTRAPTFDHVLPHSRGATSSSDSQSAQITRV
jgi:hypothetical protein